jgi:hypothetical protein
MSEDVRQILSRNVSARMVEKFGRENKLRLHAESKVGEQTVHRLTGGEHWIGLEALSKVASALDREPWQLLHPESPRARALSETARHIGEMFDATPDAQKPRAYALIVQILEFGNAGSTGPAGADEPTDVPPAPPQTPPGAGPASPPATRAPGRDHERPEK